MTEVNNTIVGNINDKDYTRYTYFALIGAALLGLLSNILGLVGVFIGLIGAVGGLLGLVGLIMCVAGIFVFKDKFQPLESAHHKFLAIVILGVFIVSFLLAAVLSGLVLYILNLIVYVGYVLILYSGYKLFQSSKMPTVEAVKSTFIKTIEK